MAGTKWIRVLGRLFRRLADGDAEAEGYLKANAEMICRVVRGQGPDDDKAAPDRGARFVCNISSVHLPAFCSAPTDGKTYKNGYDRGRFRIGEDGEVPRRRLVDQALPIKGNNYEKIYFGAVEVNGTGIRYYGDLCLVLKNTEIDPATAILDRNSYDLLRPPLSNRVDPTDPSAMRHAAGRLAGSWGTDTGLVAAVKVLERLPFRTRRLTTGLVSNTVLEDEDYIEVLKEGSFDRSALEEVRTAASDVAAELQIGERLQAGRTPPAAALLWRRRRQDAERALQTAGIELRTVSTTGRVRS